jgi:hypothetical protein
MVSFPARCAGVLSSNQNFFISASDFVQRAAIVALREAGGEVVERRKT